MVKTYLEPVEVEKLEEASEYLRDRLLVRLLFRTGCRVSEALGIAVDDIDFAQGTVTIEHLKARIIPTCPNCGARLSKTAKFCPGCGVKVRNAVAKMQEHRRVRTMPLDKDTLKLLKQYIKRGGPMNREGRMLIFDINRHRAW